MTASNPIRTMARAAVLALALAGATMTATAPAQASPGLTFSFFEDDEWHDDVQWEGQCMSDHDVRQFVIFSGYRNVQFFDRSGRIVQVLGVAGKHRYALAIDSCAAEIVGKKRVRW